MCGCPAAWIHANSLAKKREGRTTARIISSSHTHGTQGLSRRVDANTTEKHTRQNCQFNSR